MASREILIEYTREGVLKLNRAIADSNRLLKQFGSILVSDSMEAFQLQRFGDSPWKPVYPAQKGPALNVAWALKDFAEGRAEPNPRRFSKTAGLATGHEPNQISFHMLGDDAVEVGSVMDGANAMQTGNVLGSIPVTSAMKALIAAWIAPKAGRKRADASASAAPEGAPYASKLARFLAPTVTEYRIKGYARPFIGMLDQRREDFAELLAEQIQREAQA